MRPVFHGYYAPGDEFRFSIGGCWFSLDIRCGYWHLGIGRRRAAPAAAPGMHPWRVTIKWIGGGPVSKMGRKILLWSLCGRTGRLRTWSL